MKRIATLLLIAVFALGSVSAAKADGIDLKVHGQWDFAFGWADNIVFSDNVAGRGDRDNDPFIARHRIRTQINFITSEYLQGVLMFEIGNLDWGRQAQGAALDADGVNVETKRAYLDWMIPNTPVSVRMGIQGLKLPSTPMGSPVFDADVAGVVVSSPITDWVSVTGFWIRPFDAYANDGSGHHYDDEVDAFGLVVPFKGKGWEFNPWGIYGFVGANSQIFNYLFSDKQGHYTMGVGPSTGADNAHTKVWWAGAHGKLDLFDPLVLNVEGIYGELRPAPYFATGPDWGTKGWYAAATLDYKLDWGIPGLLGWYASGDDKDAANDGKLGRLPVLGNDTGSFKPTSFGTSGKWAIDTDTVVTGTATGTWGVGLKLADMSFIEDLKHTIRVVYYEGTNSAKLVRKTGGAIPPFKYAVDGLYLTTKDSVIEVNFDHTYQVYENLTAVLELGWLHLSADDRTWHAKSNKDENSDAWKAQLIFQYKF